MTWLNEYPTALHGPIQELLGCAWGRSIFSLDDPSLCPERANQVVVLYRNGEPCPTKLCVRHVGTVLDPAVSTPHVFPEDDENRAT